MDGDEGLFWNCVHVEYFVGQLALVDVECCHLDVTGIAESGVILAVDDGDRDAIGQIAQQAEIMVECGQVPLERVEVVALCEGDGMLIIRQLGYLLRRGISLHNHDLIKSRNAIQDQYYRCRGQGPNTQQRTDTFDWE